MLVGEIEFVGEEMQLLAINAAVSAAHARQRGAGLDVIAQNIQDVAEESCHYAFLLAQLCNTITEHARHLQAVEQGNQSGIGGVRSLIEEAQERMKNLETSHTTLVSLTERIDRDARDLSHEVALIISTLNIGYLFKEKLAPVLKRFNELSFSADERLSTSENTNLEVLFYELELCYTMASERQIHQSFMGSQRQSAEELTEQEDEWAANRHHDLGDNVDLF